MNEYGQTGSAQRRQQAPAVAILVALGFSLSVACLSFAQAATQPASADALQIQRALEELTHKEPAVRDRARTQLMGLSREGLGELRDAVDHMRPLSPAQAAVLHDVVVHAYVAGGPERDRMPMLRKSGFLGVLLEPVVSGYGVNQDPPAPPDDDPPNLGQIRATGGVLIKETWPGFAGFRFLRVGDVVVGTGGAQPTHAPTVQELRAAVQATDPDDTLDLQVLRQGRIMNIAVQVSARPTWAEDELTTRQMQSRRLRRAENYWQFAFAPLLWKDDGMS